MTIAASNPDLTLECPDAIGVLETTAPVVAAARSVRIEPEAVARAADRLAGAQQRWQAPRARLGQTLSLARRPWPRGQCDAGARRAQFLLLGRSGPASLEDHLRGGSARRLLGARGRHQAGDRRRRAARSGTPISSPTWTRRTPTSIFHPTGVEQRTHPDVRHAHRQYARGRSRPLRASTTAGSARRSRLPMGAPRRWCSGWSTISPRSTT